MAGGLNSFVPRIPWRFRVRRGRAVVPFTVRVVVEMRLAVPAAETEALAPVIAPKPRPALIDLNTVPSSMEQLAARWGRS